PSRFRARKSGPPTVFISYTQDSPAHSEQVLRLADALREHGIDADIDRYHEPPPQGWARWTDEQLQPSGAGHVLMICTRTYLAHLQSDFAPIEKPDGFATIREFFAGDRFLTVVLDGGTADGLPDRLRTAGHYR